MLLKDEEIIRDNWRKNKSFTSIPDTNKEKFFGTFPIPYQNGALHLGHLYTLSKVEFYARFQMLKNKNVLLPFGFHGTGMPIVSSANKLKESLLKYDIKNIDMNILDDSDQIKILYNMAIPLNEIPNFTDPYYWLEYFPKRAIEDLNLFGICADFSRSFVTTDINPYFDSFIKWQFDKLNKGGHLIFGKKTMIYSPKNNQACSDDDRSKGEGIGIKEFFVYYVQLDDEITNLIVTNDTEIKSTKIKCILVNTNHNFTLFTINGKQFIARSEYVRNLQYQTEAEIIIKSNINIDNLNVNIQKTTHKINGSGLKFMFEKGELSDENMNSHYKYYEPEEEVISRAGDICVVAIRDQWFINYNNTILKQKIEEYINHELIINDSAKNMLLSGLEWIKEYPCSRSQGLGTKLLDTEYFIDSLSDSTIYMAFYTVCHKIHNIPKEIINFDIWEYILCDGDISNVDLKYHELLLELRNEFKYWYALDLRVSAKDLSMNHLIMTLYNHLMIWDINMLPKRYFINGYVLLNGEKMSKSKGIFMTLKDAMTKFGADPTRIALACAGSEMNDANFLEQNANSAILRLDTEKDWCLQMIDFIKNSTYAKENTFWDDIFETDMLMCVKNTEHMFNMMDYQKVLTSGFYDMLSIRDNYRNKYNSKLIDINPNSIKKYLNNFLLAIYPIIPHFVEYLWNYANDNGIIFDKLWPNNICIPSKLLFHKNIFNNVVKTINSNIDRLIKRNKTKEQNKFNVTITMFNTFSNEETNILNSVKKFMESNINWNIIHSTIMNNIEDKKQIGVYGKMLTYINSSIEIYGNEWLNYITDVDQTIELYHIVSYWLPKIILNKTIGDISVICEDNDPSFKFNPANPCIKFNM
jgi:leucyl-tRNA synthetase